MRISGPDEPVFNAAGLYGENDYASRGERVPVFTVCSVRTMVLFGTVQDRARMVLRPSSYEAWLNGGDAARSQLGHAPRSEELRIAPVHAADGYGERRRISDAIAD